MMLIVGLGASAVAQIPAELRKVHALLVIDTRSGLGESVKLDGERVDRILSSNLPPDRVEIRVLTDKDVTVEAILGYYKNLKISGNDALFFYYAGHGATDPQKGHFLALQELNARPLLRDELRRAMQEHGPGLAVLITDCCSNRFKLPGRARRVISDEGTARTIHPVLRCLLYQSRGLVDLTAASGNVAFGDDHDGGLFTRTFEKLVRSGIPPSDTNHDGFVSWPEFFAQLQTQTENTFVTWAQRQRAMGATVDQNTQRPFAYELGSVPDTVSLRNDTAGTLSYQYRWKGQTSWESSSIPPQGMVHHASPAIGGGAAAPRLEVRFEGAKTAELPVGKTYRFHETRSARGREAKPRKAQ
jgi:hypothetical protein